MIIAQFSKSDLTGGGASRVAEELSLGMCSCGIECHHWLRFSGHGFDYKTSFPLYGGCSAKWFSCINRLVARAGYPELLPLELLTLMRRDWVAYDLFHFHDLSGAISPFTLQWLSSRRPVIWTFHDCSPFTAGCLYPMECERYKDECGRCPQLGRWPLGCSRDRTKKLLDIKRRLHSTRRIVTVSPSAWMADMAVESGIVLDRPRVIPNGVDLEVFRPNANREDAKSFLGVKSNRPVVLVSANSLSDPRKGAAHSFDAIKSICDLDPFVVLVGNNNVDIENCLSGIDHICTGFISDESLLMRWYSVADVFLFCSLADNLPLTILETMACGVPIVGFKTGGIPEMVEQDVTGTLVRQKDQDALNSELRRALTTGVAKKWGAESRRKVEREFSMEKFISAHKSLYDESIAAFADKRKCHGR